MIKKSNISSNKPFDIGDDEESFDIKGFLGKLIASWWVFLISFIVCGLLAALVMYYKAPAYNITSEILIDDGSSNASSIASSSSSMLDLSSLLNLKNNVDNEAQMLQTRHLMESVVRDMNLNIIYYQRRLVTDLEINRNPVTVSILKPVDTIETTKFKVDYIDNKKVALKYKETFPDLSTHKVDTVVNYDKPFFVAGVGIINISLNSPFSFGNDSYRFDIESVDQRVYDLQQILTITVTSTTVSTIDLVFDYPIPREGENILNDLIRTYQRQNVRLKNQVADSTISFIDGRLRVVGRNLEGIETNVQNFKQKNTLLGDLTEQGKLLVDNTAVYSDQMAKNAIVLSVTQSLLDYLNDEKNNKTVVPNAIVPGDLILAGLISNYNGLIAERDRQGLSVTADNPYMKNLEERIVTLRKDMIKYLNNTEKSLQITDAHLKQRTGQFTNQITNVPPKEKIYLDLERQQAIQQTIYTYLLQTKEETEISKTSNISIATIVDPPKSDYKPYSPNPILVAAGAVILALAFPVARIFVKDSLNTKILTREDITKNTEVPISGEVSHDKTAQSMVVLNSTRSAIAEQFRALRTNLQFFINKADEKVILVTSSMSGEGKSFTTINLAGALAISGKRVLLMELDMRKPKISTYFGLDNNNGFSNYIIS